MLIGGREAPVGENGFMIFLLKEAGASPYGYFVIGRTEKGTPPQRDLEHQ
jgi:hypothetical protein